MKDIANLENLREFIAKFKGSLKEPLFWGIATADMGETELENELNYKCKNYKENFLSFWTLFYSLSECGDKIKSEGRLVVELKHEAVLKFLDAFSFLLEDLKPNSHKNLELLLEISKHKDDKFYFVAVFDN